MIYLSISTGYKVSSDNKRVGDPDPKASNCTCWPMPSRRIATTLIEKAEGVNEAGCEKEQKQSWYATSKCHDCNISFQSICIYKLQVRNIFIHVVYIPHPFSSHIHSITFKVLSWIWSICCWTWTFTNCNHQFPAFSAWLVDAVETLEWTWAKYEAMERPLNMVEFLLPGRSEGMVSRFFIGQQYFTQHQSAVSQFLTAGSLDRRKKTAIAIVSTFWFLLVPKFKSQNIQNITLQIIPDGITATFGG